MSFLIFPLLLQLELVSTTHFQCDEKICFYFTMFVLGRYSSEILDEASCFCERNSSDFQSEFSDKVPTGKMNKKALYGTFGGT